jgi:hypothetical protein
MTTPTRVATPTLTPDAESVRRAGLAGATGAALTVLAGVLVQGVVRPGSDIPEDRWSFPWSSSAFVPVSIVYAVLHVLVAVGLLGFARSRATGDGRGGRIAALAAVAGTAVLAVAELLSIPIADQRTDDTGPQLVAALFGAGSVVSMAGFLVAGVATVRARRWDSWRRYTPLALGVWMIAMLPLLATSAMAAAITVYGLLLLALCVAVATRPTPGT